MDDLISRQEAIDAIEQLWDWKTVDGITASTALKQVKSDILNFPSAQPEIIRCKDCKWHLTYHDEKYNVGYELCSNPMMMIGDSMIDMNNNDFCSKAERRTDE